MLNTDIIKRRMFQEQMTDGLQYVYIKDIKPAQKNLNVIFIILEIGKPHLIHCTLISVYHMILIVITLIM
jgi:hypothetical protein